MQVLPDIAGIQEKRHGVGNGALEWELGGHSSFSQGVVELL